MTWKLATFNVNGLRARLATVVDWISEHQPDVLCMQEIKCQDQDFPADPLNKPDTMSMHAGRNPSTGSPSSPGGSPIKSSKPLATVSR